MKPVFVVFMAESLFFSFFFPTFLEKHLLQKQVSWTVPWNLCLKENCNTNRIYLWCLLLCEQKLEQVIWKSSRFNFGIMCVCVQKLERSWWKDVWGEESVKCQNQEDPQYCCFKTFFAVFVVLWELKIFPVAWRSSRSRQKPCRKAWLQLDILC